MGETIVIGRDLEWWELENDLTLCMTYGHAVGIDSETEGIDPTKEAPACGKGRIACWSLSTPTHPKVFLWGDLLEQPRVKQMLESPGLRLVGHNIYGFDYHMFKNHGITLGNIAGDTMRMSKLLYCCKMRKHNLKDLALNWLGVEQPKFKNLFMRPAHTMEFRQCERKVKGQRTFYDQIETKRKVGDHRGVPTVIQTGEYGKFGKRLEFVPLSSIPELYPERLEALYEYASADADITRQLYAKFSTELRKVEWNVEK